MCVCVCVCSSYIILSPLMQLELEMFQSKLITEQSTLEALVAGGVAPGGVASGDGEENRELAKQLAVVNYLQVPLPQCVCVSSLPYCRMLYCLWRSSVVTSHWSSR